MPIIAPIFRNERRQNPLCSAFFGQLLVNFLIQHSPQQFGYLRSHWSLALPDPEYDEKMAKITAALSNASEPPSQFFMKMKLIFTFYQ